MNRVLILPEEAHARYLERRKMDLSSLRADLNSLGLEEFKRVGHQLRGNASSFGYPELEILGGLMEEAGRRHDKVSAKEHLEQFAAWVSSKTARSSR